MATGAEIVFKSMCFEMHGLEHEVRAAVNLILELELIKVRHHIRENWASPDCLIFQAFHHEIRFQIELANEHREFISGKKNGKINKIMQTTNVKIKFETFNDHNFLIDISGPDLSVIQGLSLLQEELPAEISFHVPEGYHKRIIGVAGRSIQRIMKKYGVYVKFSNAEEFAALGGYNDNEDNVVARTPAKNAMNLENLKQAVMELVNPKVRLCELFTVPVQTLYRIRTLSMRRSPSLAVTTAPCWVKRASSSMISRRRPIPAFVSLTRKLRPMLSRSMVLNLKSKSQPLCYWYVSLSIQIAFNSNFHLGSRSFRS